MAVCCLDEEGSWGEGLRDEQVDVTALRRRDGFRPMLGKAIARIAARHRVNVVHCHHYSPFVYAAMAKLWMPNLHIIFTEHGRLSDAPASPKRRMANRVLAHAPRRVVTVSAELREHLVAEGFPADKVRVIYNGIEAGPPPDAEARRRMRRALAIPDDILVAATVARLDPVKDLGTLIHAMARQPQPARLLLLVIGDGSERAGLEALTRERGAEPVVRFLGHREDARELLAGCDLYVNSSISEGISLTILEAMAARLAVVATRAGGTPEILDPTCGRLVPLRDPEALGATLAALGDDPILRAALGRAARARVEERFTLDRMVAQYRDAYYAVA
jgi:glycosyltransferase involved in cell wall biosynthesis